MARLCARAYVIVRDKACARLQEGRSELRALVSAPLTQERVRGQVCGAAPARDARVGVTVMCVSSACGLPDVRSFNAINLTSQHEREDMQRDQVCVDVCESRWGTIRTHFYSPLGVSPASGVTRLWGCRDRSEFKNRTEQNREQCGVM